MLPNVTQANPRPPVRAVGVWLLVVAAMIVGQVLLGGVTRLTGSGLSITEWNLVVGVLPPMNDAAWAEAFDKYQQIPQFQRLNAHFELADFQHIYFWEWLHRLWGRLLGGAFVVPMLVFWRRRALVGLGPSLLGLFALGALQGFLGWFMVASGLRDLVYVSHIRLAVHFIAAIALLVGVVWVALSQLVSPSQRRVAEGDAKLAWWLIGVVTLQMAWGAFMAGLKAAAAAPSWPSINGLFLPYGIFATPGDLMNNPLTVHFIHRNLAYLLTVLVIAYWFRLLRTPAPGHWRWTRHSPAMAVFAQVLLGIAVLLHVGAPSFVALGVAHQLGSVLVLLSLVCVANLSTPAPAESGAKVKVAFRGADSHT